MAERRRCVFIRAECRKPCLDIFRKDAHGNPVWINGGQDLDDARHRPSELALALPGEYFVFDHRTHTVVYQQSQLDFTCT